MLVVDQELVQCLTALPPLVAQMEEYRRANVCDLNLIEWFIMRIEQFLEFLRVLLGKDNLVSVQIFILVGCHCVCVCVCNGIFVC